VQHPLDNILTCGFIAGHGASRPARRIETASVLACISMECAQNEMHGGQAIPAFDFYLAPYVRMTFVEELKNIEDLILIEQKQTKNSNINIRVKQKDKDLIQEYALR
jgi:ribonucleoside-triphosphate reductase